MYPPHVGGYEVIWRSSVAYLRDRGDGVRVLTGDAPAPAGPSDPDVHRELRMFWREHRFLELGARQRIALERHNARVLSRHLDEVSPEAVIWWGMGGLPLSLIERVRRRGLPAVGVVADPWMLYAPATDPWMRVFLGGRGRRLARPFERLAGVPTSLDLGGAAEWIFIAEELRESALRRWPLERTSVAHPGPDSELFGPQPGRDWGWRLAYVGRLDERKGVALALRALAHVPAKATLTVDGGGDERYREQLRGLSRELGVEERVSFKTSARADLPRTYAEADAVVFPVLWEEPWGLVPLEAMAMARPVVTSGRGGQRQYVRSDENCLVFDPAEGPRGLAAVIGRLAAETLRAKLVSNGLTTAERYSQASFNRAIEEALDRAVSQARK